MDKNPEFLLYVVDPSDNSNNTTKKAKSLESALMMIKKDSPFFYNFHFALCLRLDSKQDNDILLMSNDDVKFTFFNDNKPESKDFSELKYSCNHNIVKAEGGFKSLYDLESCQGVLNDGSKIYFQQEYNSDGSEGSRYIPKGVDNPADCFLKSGREFIDFEFDDRSMFQDLELFRFYHKPGVDIRTLNDYSDIYIKFIQHEMYERINSKYSLNLQKPDVSNLYINNTHPIIMETTNGKNKEIPLSPSPVTSGELMLFAKLKGEINGEFEALYLAKDKEGGIYKCYHLPFEGYEKGKWDKIDKKEYDFLRSHLFELPIQNLKSGPKMSKDIKHTKVDALIKNVKKDKGLKR